MTTYVFRCSITETTIDHDVPSKHVPPIGDSMRCVCGESRVRPHPMVRIVPPVNFAEVKGTGNGPIGRGLQDRAELGRKRRAEWK